jgi:ribosomal protein S18 acetylase RimI-like enzyme
MEELKPGFYWKTPFLWDDECKVLQTTAPVVYEAAEPNWLSKAVAQTLSTSLDASDQYAVAQLGARKAAEEFLSMAPKHFDMQADWWRMAKDEEGNRVGYVLPVLYKGKKSKREGRPESTIFYMGVLPEYRGKGYGKCLLEESIRVCKQANVWRLFCDTATDNQPMIKAFREVGFKEEKPWQQSIS